MVLLLHLSNRVQQFLLLLLAAVAEVQTKDVGAGQEEPLDHLSGGRGGAERRELLGRFAPPLCEFGHGRDGGGFGRRGGGGGGALGGGHGKRGRGAHVQAEGTKKTAVVDEGGRRGGEGRDAYAAADGGGDEEGDGGYGQRHGGQGGAGGLLRRRHGSGREDFLAREGKVSREQRQQKLRRWRRRQRKSRRHRDRPKSPVFLSLSPFLLRCGISFLF
mmetsp:Transcript_35719/g.65751  ORF Transcript_35719/g.65751 Transcript_35719/m.65751 type:complete len:217 (-) Transcript_35719:64-714(-)